MSPDRIRCRSHHHRGPALLIALGLSLVLSGCGELRFGGSFRWSRGTLAPSEGWEQQAAGHGLTRPDLTMYVVPENARRSRRWVIPVALPLVFPPLPDWGQVTSGPPTPFRITLWFYPEVDGFTFDPGRVVLTMNQRERKTVDRVTECGSRTVEPPVPLRHGLCLLLFFAMDPPSPSVKFSLLVDGLEKAGMAIPPALVHFSED